MPRREDERRLNLSGKHPEACTCKDCTDRFLKKKGIKPRGRPGIRLFGREMVKRHRADCGCASCSLLRSMDHRGSVPAKGGFLRRLFGKQ